MVHASILKVLCTKVDQPDHYELTIKTKTDTYIKILETSELRVIIGVLDNAIGSKVIKEIKDEQERIS